MNTTATSAAHLEGSLARLLYYGTWLASSAIAVGLALALVNSSYIRWATGGIGMLILLPVLRVSLMLFFFLRDRDYRLAIAAALVLTIILLAVLIGLRSAESHPAVTSTELPVVVQSLSSQLPSQLYPSLA
jgi:uncharacterized membrane protein